MGGSSSKDCSSTKGHDHSSNLKKSQISSQDRVKLQLKVQRDNLRAAINKYEHIKTLEKDKAVILYKEGNKRKALFCLKCVKVQESRINSLNTMFNNIAQLIDTMELKETEVQVFEALKTGNEELVKLNNILKIEDIEKLLSETEESIELAKQIDEILEQPIDNRMISDAELLEELLENTQEEDVSALNRLESIKISAKNPKNIQESRPTEKVLEAV